jgi:hypothetical protein
MKIAETAQTIAEKVMHLIASNQHINCEVIAGLVGDELNSLAKTEGLDVPRNDADLTSAIKYKITPIVDGELQDWPLSPEALTAEEVGVVILGRLKAMENQGHWRDNSGNRIPLKGVNYIIEVDELDEHEGDDEGVEIPDDDLPEGNKPSSRLSC